MIAPATVAELSEVIRQQAAKREAVYPRGGGTLSHLGLPARRPGVQVDLRHLRAVLDYPARDMTVTVQAGMTIAELAAMLAQENQWLPVDGPFPDRATLGGAIAANVSGPRRHGWGTWRDYVIGCSYLNDAGVECKAGGRVVKNVAGYDLCKLFTGSFGTLGILTQVTLKLRPRPQTQALLVFPITESELGPTLAALRQTQARPTMVTLTNRSGALQLLVGVEESRPAVAWQLETLRSELTPIVAGSPRLLEDRLVDDEVAALTDACWPQTGVSFRVAVPPSRLLAWWPQVRDLNASWCVHAGVGVAYGHVAALPADGVHHLRRCMEAVGGTLEVLRYPDADKTAALLWGPPRPELALAREVKRQFDPQGIFNPGRWWCDAE